MAEVYISQTSAIYFCLGLSCCLYYWGVHYSRVSKVRVDCMYKSTLKNVSVVFYLVTHQGISVCNVFLCYVLKICFILWSFVQVFREKILQLLQTRSAMFNLKVRCMTTGNLMKKKDLFGFILFIS